ncbi:CalY family protein [Actinotalea sp. M2MS4P-6]|uniref:CalY family protein n=1 Tax=Actinotalea sp. M2MS4P-6 TaxID=2983762 RepID=UPI0021E5112A|nr:CalY family protein [Actinotalea sp. M2MS4P-6]MCV2394883.1 CalY family protein [Actinotalea sp. M2MS4P-6]
MDDLIREMIAPQRRSDLDRGRRTRLVATATTVGLAAIGLTTLTTGALFTDADTTGSANFTTGTVDISATHSATQTLGALNLAPGDVAYGVVPVSNDGTLELRYALSAQGSNDDPAVDLAGQFELTVYAGVAAASCNAAGVAAATSWSMSGVPTTLTPLIGSSATGQDTDDRVLAAKTAEDLCVSVGLPLSTGNEFQGATASIDLQVDAEQTVNNP